MISGNELSITLSTLWFDRQTHTNRSAHRMDRSKRAQIRLNLGSRLGSNARSADRAFVPNVTMIQPIPKFSFLFTKSKIPMNAPLLLSEAREGAGILRDFPVNEKTNHD